MIDVLWQDVRYALRSLRRTPGFTTAAIITLALGIGATTAMYSVIDDVLVRPMPFPDHDRLIMLWETDRDSGTTREPGSFPDFLDYTQRAQTVDRLAAFIAGEMNMTPDNGDPVRVVSLTVTSRFLPQIGVTPIVGRVFDEAEDRPGGPNAVVISQRLWDTLFQRSPSAIGRTIRLNGRPRTIVGVASQTAEFGTLQILSAADYSRGFADRDPRAHVDVWVPMQGDVKTMVRDNHPLLMLGRLASGSSPEAAQKELAAIATDLEKTFPENRARGVLVERVRDVVVGPVRPALIVLMAAVVCLLLIACVNVAHLLLVRASTRGGEVAVRSALGAGLGRLTRQFIVESAILTLISTAVGVAIAVGGLQVFRATGPADIPALSTIAIDARVLVVSFVLSTIVALVFGLLPVSFARRADVRSALRTGDGRTSPDRHRAAGRSMLVATEVALAVTLLVAAGLLVKTFWTLYRTDPGFRTAGVFKAELQLPPTRYPINMREYPKAEAIHTFNQTLLSRVSALPGVEAVGLAANHPLDVGFATSFVVVGRERESRDWPEIPIRRVTPGYFKTLSIPLIDGRLFDNRDAADEAPVVIINRAAADRFFRTENPVGHEIRFWGPVSRRIVGVVGNEKFHGIAAEAPFAVYAPLAQAPADVEALIVRTTSTIAGMATTVRSAVREIDPALAVFSMEGLDQTVANSIREQRFLASLLALFAGVALLLAVVGIHGVLSYTVVQRTREIGVRMALGATARQVAGLVIAQGSRGTVIGLIAGLAIGLTVAQSLRGLLYGVSPVDPMALASVLGLLAAVASFSIWLPARRAARVEPTVALRAE